MNRYTRNHKGSALSDFIEVICALALALLVLWAYMG